MNVASLRLQMRDIQDEDARVTDFCVDILDMILAVDSGEDAWKDWELYALDGVEKIRLEYNALDMMNLGVSVAFTWDKSGEGGVEVFVHTYKEMSPKIGTVSTPVLFGTAIAPLEIQELVQKALEYLK